MWSALDCADGSGLAGVGIVGEAVNSPQGGCMDKHKFLLAFSIAMVMAVPLAAHPGPEPHPTVQELEAVESDLRLTIGEVERRLGERIDGHEASASELDEQTVAEIAKGVVVESVDELVRSSGELRDWVDTVIGVGAALIAGLASVSVYLGLRVRSLAKLPLKPPNQGSRVHEAKAKPTDEPESEAEKDEEEPKANRRVVTHTRKAGVRQTIEELHNPDEQWSPRTVKDAISDIEDRRIVYVSRGPEGNEAEIEVWGPSSNRYLRTKPDEYGGNNLSELPDPP